MSDARKYVCSVSDPFCDHALGAKVMDLGSTRSFPISYRTRLTLSSTANGDASVLIAPNYDYTTSMLAFSITSGVAVFSGAMSASGNVAAESVRLVSMGIKLRSIVAPLSASGITRIRAFGPNSVDAVAGGVDIATFNCDYSADLPVHSLTDTALILRRYDIKAKEFIDPATINPNSSIGASHYHGWGFYMVSLQGCPATTPVLDIEIISHWEIVIGDNDPLMQAATAAPAYKPWLDEAADVVSSTIRPVFSEGVRYATNAVTRAAAQALAARLGAGSLPRLGT
jgi:hypothetical protein